MRRMILLIVVPGVFAMLRGNACADEVWTYKFIVNGSRPYRGECDCFQDTYADIGGTFSILLNWQNFTGRILELDDHLTNLAYGTNSPATGLVMTPANLPEADYGIIPPWQVAPLPDGHFSYANNTGHLVSNGNQPLFPAVQYDITFSRQGATLNMSAGAIDALVLVTNATAVFSKSTLAGDYNGDGRVDALDYVALRNGVGSAPDFALWRSYFGSTTAAVGGAAVPEASTAWLLGAACLCGGVVVGGRRGRLAVRIGDRALD